MRRRSNWRWEDQLVSYCNTVFKKRWRQSRWRVKNSGEIFWSWWRNLVSKGLCIFTYSKIFLEVSAFFFLYVIISQFVEISAVAAAKSLQSCPTLCDPLDGSPPGSPVPGILQARILEWVAISFSNAWKWKVKVKLLSRVQLLAIPWTAAYQAPLSMGFSRQEHWSGLPLPSPY